MVGDNESRMLGLQSGRIDIDKRGGNKVTGIVRFHSAWVPNVVYPSLFELQKCLRSLLQQRFERLDVSANADAFDAEAHIFEVFCKPALAAKMNREVGDQTVRADIECTSSKENS
jgi:hypothetical protein